MVKFGDDQTINTSVQEISTNIPTTIVKYGTFKYYLFLTRPKMFTIWIAHGNEKGIQLKQKVIPWQQISKQIKTNTGKNIFISCYATNLQKYTNTAITIGNKEIDVELATNLALYLLTGKNKFLNNSLNRLINILSGKEKPQFLKLINGGSSSSGNSNNPNNNRNNNGDIWSTYIIGNMSYAELLFHAVTISVVIIEAIMFEGMVPPDLKQTVMDRIAVQLFMNTIPTFLVGIIPVIALAYVGKISINDALSAIISYLFDLFGFLLATVEAWINSRTDPLERYFWLTLLWGSIASKIVNPTGLLSVVVDCVPLIGALFAAAMDYFDPDSVVGHSVA